MLIEADIHHVYFHDARTSAIVLRALIARGASIGAGAVVLPGITIGAGAMIGAGAVVTRDVPPGETWIGNPARKLEKRR